MESEGPPPEGDVNQKTPIIIYIVILIFATILIVTLRFIVRIFITKVIGWDDWTILFALVGPLPLKISLLRHRLISKVVGQRNRLWTSPRGDALWFWAASILPYKVAAYRIPEIRLWGMDSDLCYFNVDKSLNMSFFEADSRHKSTHQTARYLHWCLDFV